MRDHSLIVIRIVGLEKVIALTSAFEGIAPTPDNADLLIRNILRNPDREFIGDKAIDVYNANGQGVRFKKNTYKFITFLEESLATQ